MFEEIYNIFKMEMDGEEFDSDDDALLAANIEMKEILGERNWKFLLKTTTLPAGTLSYASIADLDKVIKVWDDGTELERATFERRFDTEKDYWIDVPNKTLAAINTGILSRPLTLDYKAKVDAITAENDILPDVEFLRPLIAYRMCLHFYRKDQDTTVFELIRDKETSAHNALISYNENL